MMQVSDQSAVGPLLGSKVCGAAAVKRAMRSVTDGLVVLNVEYSGVLYTYVTDLEGYLSSASQVIDDINDNNLVEKDPIQSFDINDLDLTNNLYYKLDRGQLGKSLFFGKGASLIVAR